MHSFLHQCRHWVFDMDGTLTLAVHDFDHIRQQLQIPPGADILSHLDSLPVDEAAAAHHWLLEHERALAEASLPAPGAVELVRHLAQDGHQLAILTRNAHELARVTLDAIGILDCFNPELILGREQAAPKPAPDGMLTIARRWQATPEQLCMVGDFHYDLSSARNAGSRAILVNHPENLWPELTCLHARDCHQLLELLTSPASEARP